jgi:hypothetical protein
MELVKQDLEKSVKWLTFVIAVIVFMTIPRQCFGKDVSSMYTKEELKLSMAGYSGNISFNYEKVIKPVLTKQELAVLNEVRLEYPLIDIGGDPFRCYAKVDRAGRAIVIPTFTIKFLEDLATSVAWLRHNDFTTETLPEYISMLKYQQAKGFNNGRYPTPLQALHIPPRPRDNDEVDELAKDFLKTTVVYLLSREIGFLYFSRSNPRSTEFRTEQRLMVQQVALMRRDVRSEKMELMLKSDDFAMEIMRRIGAPPEGLSFYLSAQTYWTQNHIDIPNEEAYSRYWYEPPEYAMFPERLYQIANLMVSGKEDYIRQKDDKAVSAFQVDRGAREIFKLSYILENQSVQSEIKQGALKRRIEDLKLRRR